MMNAKTSAVADGYTKKVTGEKTTMETSNIKGYLAISNSPINVDDPSNNLEKPRLILRDIESDNNVEYQSDNNKIIGDIASFLSTPKSENNKEEKNNELIIMIHGYKTDQDAAIKAYKKRFNFIQNMLKNYFEHNESEVKNNRKLVVIGYTWPSEDFLEKFVPYVGAAFKTLPIPFEIINNLLFLIVFLMLALISFTNSISVVILIIFVLFAIGNIILLLSFIFGWWIDEKSKFILDIISMSFCIFSLLSWFFLDFIVDAFDINQVFYRVMIVLLVIGSTYLGIVLTFITLRITAYFRDKYRAMFFAVADLVNLITTLNNNEELKRNDKPIKLSFIAHSMGAFVATHTIRTLCNAFDNDHNNNKDKNTQIGTELSLGRLILASPDISIQAIFPGKSNVLETAIDKCEEAYLFSNQGDMILRVFSMISNYFRFPAESAERGFRLGNIIVYHNPQSQESYEILNRKYDMSKEDFLKNLCIVYRDKRRSLYELLGSYKKLPNNMVTTQVTYFDCTDCRDHIRDKNDQWSKELKPILSRATNHQIICVLQCLELLIQWTLGKIDIHGGYFDGKFCQTMIYGLACLGWEEFNDFWVQCQQNTEGRTLSAECKDKGIQGLLSPELEKKLKTQT
ncbi:MAG: alpha/beta hydrolase [Crocosphaera sp.]